MPDLEQNKETVRAFYDLAFNRKKPEEAVARYVGSNYIQHNPMAGDGPGPFIDLRPLARRIVHDLLEVSPVGKIEVQPKQWGQRLLRLGDLLVCSSRCPRGETKTRSSDRQSAEQGTMSTY